jgi:tetratricopeptide (TPR) repeat protein
VRLASAAPLLVGLLALAAAQVWPRGATEPSARADALYDAGTYGEAADEYAKLLEGASRATGERAAEILFDRGDALYRVGDYARARDAFEQAGLRTRVLELESSAAYNMGNCSYREAEASIGKGDLPRAVAALEESIAAYRRSLDLQSGKRQAGTNLEVARTVLKGVRDELAKAGDVQDLQREILETLKKLIPRQEALVASTGGESADATALRDSQEGLRSDTRSLLDRFDLLLERIDKLLGQSASASPHREARRHVESSAGHQGRAVGALAGGDRAAALGPEKSSLEELRKALEILTPPERQDRSQQGNEGDNGQAAGAGAAGPPPSGSGEQGAQPEQSTGSYGTMERPEDILQEEGDMRRARDAQQGIPRSPVDKDW